MTRIGPRYDGKHSYVISDGFDSFFRTSMLFEMGPPEFVEMKIDCGSCLIDISTDLCSSERNKSVDDDDHRGFRFVFR